MLNLKNNVSYIKQEEIAKEWNLRATVTNNLDSRICLLIVWNVNRYYGAFAIRSFDLKVNFISQNTRKINESHKENSAQTCVISICNNNESVQSCLRAKQFDYARK